MLFRFKGSSLKVLGDLIAEKDCQWAIIGGTGEFAYAQGVVNAKTFQSFGTGRIWELRIRAFCLCVSEMVTYICPFLTVMSKTFLPWKNLSKYILLSTTPNERITKTYFIYNGFSQANNFYVIYIGACLHQDCLTFWNGGCLDLQNNYICHKNLLFHTSKVTNMRTS